MATAKEKLIASAQKLVEKGSFEKAIKEYLRVVQEDNADVRIWLKIGDLYAKIGKKQEATDTYQRVAQFYSDQGFYLKSVAVYKQILKLEPRLVDVNQRLAELYKQLGLISDAISQYEQVAGFYHKEGKVKEALSAMKQIVDLDPETVAARIKLAEMYSREHMPREAIEEFTRAAEQLKEQQRLDEYMKVAERLLFHAPDNKPVTKELARLYIEKNDPRRALPKLQVLFKADPRDLDVLRLLARAFEGLEQRPKAVSVYKELARILNETGDARAATDVFRQILAIQPDDQEASAVLKGAGGNAPGRKLTPPPPSPLLSSSMPMRAHATGAERALDSGGHRAQQAPSNRSGSAPSVPEQDAPSDSVGEEIAKILSETDVYIKYNLHPKAIEHLQRVFERQPRHVAAREKLKALYITTGRKEEALLELWALAEHAEAGRARRYIREIFELDPSNARAAKALGETVRAPGSAAQAPAAEEVDDFSIGLDSGVSSEFGLPSTTRARPDLETRRASTIEPPEAEEDDDGAVDIDDSMLAEEDDSIAVSDDLSEELDDDFIEASSRLGGPAGVLDSAADDDLIPVVIDTGSDQVVVAPIDDEDSDRFSLDSSEEEAAPGSSNNDFSSAAPDAETRFSGGPRGVAAGPSATPAPQDDSELSFANLDEAPDEQTGLMSADELASLARSAQPKPSFLPAATARQNPDDLPMVGLDSSAIEVADDDIAPPPAVELSASRRAVVAAEPVRNESSLEDDLDESDFFMQQSLFDEARSMLNSLLERYPNHPLVLAKIRDLEAMDTGNGAAGFDANDVEHTAVPTNVSQMDLEPQERFSSANALSAQLPTDLPGDGAADVVSGVSEVSNGFAAPENTGSLPREPVEVTRRGVVQHGAASEDFETHYDLGIAYKEMGLIDAAISEFRIVMKDAAREVQCQLMIGLCYLEKQMFTEAINQFKKGLYVEGITDAEALSLYYELGAAYEKIGDPREALYYYDKVHKREPKFRDLPRRLRALRGEEPEVEVPQRSDDLDAAFDSLLDEG